MRAQFKRSDWSVFNFRIAQIYYLLALVRGYLSSNDRSVQWLHTIGWWLVLSAEIKDLIGHAHIREHV